MIKLRVQASSILLLLSGIIISVVVVVVHEHCTYSTSFKRDIIGASRSSEKPNAGRLAYVNYSFIVGSTT